MKHFNLLLGLSLFATTPVVTAQHYTIPAAVQAADMVPGQLLVRLKESQRNLLQQPHVLAQKLGALPGISTKVLFPHAQKPGKEFDRFGRKLADISLIVELKFESGTEVRQAAMLAEKTGLFEWVQPRYVHKPMFSPNDPLGGQQYHHALIKTFEAWDIEQGDTNVFIGITDAGIQFDHQDLGNVRYNYADPVNGIDDDNNGYIDDYRGWNTASNTNDPTATLSPHGMFTTGMSSATVNNAIGVAGNAYRCKFVPVRIDDANGFNYGYEGIVYLADLGCKIINASWGNTFPTPFGEAIVTYATVNNDALIVAAAGNSGLNENYYPATYPGVMSVGATGATDVRWNQTTWGPSLDISAPGELVQSCWPFNGYDVSSGTSFSSPLVAGAAALVKSHFPGYTAQQIAERLRVTADTAIYALSGNADRYHYLGSGRLNTLRALSDPDYPSIRFEQVQWSDTDGDQFPVAGDTVLLSGNFFNYLGAAQNLQVSLLSMHPSVSIVQGQFGIGALGSLSGSSNNAQPFVLVLDANAPINLDYVLKVRYSDPATGYEAFEYLQMRINRDYMDLALNNLHTTISSRGSIGYNADYATDGLGVRYQNSNSLIYASGLMLASGGQVADNVYAATLPGYDNDFTRVAAVREISTAANNDKEIACRYTTSAAGGQPIEIRQRSYASGAAGEQDYVVLEYTLKNNGGSAVSGLTAGIFTDWDIENASTNQGAFDASRMLSYAWDASNPNQYLGVKALSWFTPRAYCFNSDGAGGSINLYDGFSAVEKNAIMTGAQSRNASVSGDIANYIGLDGLALPPGDSITVAFAILGGTTLEALQAAADAAQGAYNLTVLNPQLSISNESCAGNDGAFDLTTDVPEITQVILYNGDGVELTGLDILFDNFSYSGMPAGNYTLQFDFYDGTSASLPFSIDAQQPVSLYEMFANSLYLFLPDATGEFTAMATNADSYTWDFGDGTQVTGSESTVSHLYTQQGMYTITCIASNNGCSDTASVSIEVGMTVNTTSASRDDIKVYPVPAKDLLQVQVSNPGDIIQLQLFDASGRLIQSVAQQTSMSVGSVPNGVYFLSIQRHSDIQNRRIVIAH